MEETSKVFRELYASREKNSNRMFLCTDISERFHFSFYNIISTDYVDYLIDAFAAVLIHWEITICKCYAYCLYTRSGPSPIKLSLGASARKKKKIPDAHHDILCERPTFE